MPTSETVQQLLAEARAEHEKANSPEMAAAIRLAHGRAQGNGNAASGAACGSRR
ncbi:hypothetical protein ACFXEL_35105 [Streptomyces sp. NPDC059382]|uniref:hypothetical protein n=1 Tax=Streptomyces sp. NPDC059382 TaxID=3346816 RepID=UPI00369A1094